MSEVIPLDLNLVSDNVADWNEKVGNNLIEATWQDIFNQNEINHEEHMELYHAIKTYESYLKCKVTTEQLGDYKPKLEILDGGCDVTVTFSALVTMLESKGFNLSKASELIQENNDSKLFSCFEDAQREAQLMQDQLGQPIVVCESVVDGVSFYCLKDENNKVRKKVGFVGVDIEHLLESVNG